MAQSLPNDLKIWFDRPAANWNEALPVGNGRLGAMVFGTVASERLQLNEETVWSGQPLEVVSPGAKAALPEVRRLLFAGHYLDAEKLAQSQMLNGSRDWGSYQTLGDMTLDFDFPAGEVGDYRRELDLETATARTSFSIGAVRYTREVFASKPDEAIVVRLTANAPGALSFSLN